jgi:hypothetical protein
MHLVGDGPHEGFGSSSDFGVRVVVGGLAQRLQGRLPDGLEGFRGGLPVVEIFGAELLDQPFNLLGAGVVVARRRCQALPGSQGREADQQDRRPRTLSEFSHEAPRA